MKNRKDETLFSKNIHYLRRSKGWTMDELARRLDVSEPTVSMWESGKRRPLNWEMVVAVCKLFGLTIDQLILKDLTKEEK
jgi:transcriptional regulator with XRE-family HTH domain